MAYKMQFQTFFLLKMSRIILLALLVAFCSAQRRTSCNCGWRNIPSWRIVGGTTSGVNEWPSIAGLFEVINAQTGQLFHFCGSTIITRRHVFTAAHCIRSRDPQTQRLVDKNPNNIRVLIAGHNYNTDNRNNFLKAERVAVHEYYNDQVLTYDVAMVTVAGIIPFSDVVGPACFPTTKLNLRESTVTAVGWGLMARWGRPDQGQGRRTTILQKVDLTAYDIQTCDRLWPNVFDLRNVHQICTYNQGQSVCNGDSGGPLYWLDPEINRYVLAGVSSFVPNSAEGQIGCNTVSGFVDPAAFLAWVRTQTAGEMICSKI